MNPQISCAFTGHRPERLPWGYDEDDSRCLAFKIDLEKQITQLCQEGIRHFITGMALGADLYCAEIVLALQETGEDITLECAIPCATQTRGWTEEQQERYDKILSHAHLETMVQHDYTRGCMMRRNRYMVDRANTLVAVYDGKPVGGTARTIAYAMKQEVNLFILSLYGEEYI